MITARPQKDLKAARSYFRQHLARGDYYSEKRSIQGHWFGKGAERLGLDLAAPVTQEAFVRLCENRHPLSGDQLTVRRRQKDRRVFYDFTGSPAKSVSILAVTAGDVRIIAAHDEALLVAMQQMQAAAAVRIRKGGQRAQRNTGEIVAALFRHEESRALDPQLHTHVVVFNATWDAVEKRWKALETSAMFDQINLCTEVYRSELALRLRALGYRLRNTANGFEIEGVSPDIIQRLSKRRQAILEEEARLTAKLGKPLSNDGRAAVAHATRERKRTDLTPDQLLAYQRAQLTPAELATLRSLGHFSAANRTATSPRARQGTGIQAADHSSTKELELEPPGAIMDTGHVPGQGEANPRLPADPEAARAAIDYARDHLFERASAVPRKDLLSEALRFGCGTVDLTALEAELRRRTEFIDVDGTLTTKDALRQEQRMIALVNQGLGGCRPLRPDFRAGSDLTAEQRQALQSILRSPDEVIALRGRAGTGKTKLLRELVRGIDERHASVILAPTAAAVEVLRGQGFKQAATVQRFLADPEFQRAAQGRALIVDEAGVLSLRDLRSMIEITRANRCRLILSGDARQHSGVEAGDALRILEEQSHLRPVELKNIERQVNLEYRQAIGELAEGKGQQALRRLDQLGAVEQLEDEVRYQELAERYVGSVKCGKSALIVSPTWREIEQVTLEVRARLKKQNLLGRQDVNVTVHKGLKWTRAQKRDLRNYSPGMVLTFHKATKDFSAGEWAELKAVEGEKLCLMKPDGKSVSVTRKQAACFEVATQEELPVAAGERLLLQGNRKQDKLYNGQIVTVKQVTAGGGLVLTDGRQMPSGFRAFTHGYCVTSHASQGRTVDHVYVAVDSHTLNACCS